MQFFNDGLYLGGRTYKDLDDFLLAECDGAWIAWDANDIMTLMNTWQSGDISKTSRINALQQGDLTLTLAQIKAKVLLMPAKGDMLFPVRSPF